MTRVTRRLRQLTRNRRGGILVVTAIMLPVLITVTALCVDLGTLYLAKTKVDIAATLAAEAAEQRLPDTAAAKDLAQQVALAMIDDVGFAKAYDINVTASATEVEVNIHLRMKTVLAHFADVDILDSYGTARRPLP